MYVISRWVQRTWPLTCCCPSVWCLWFCCWVCSPLPRPWWWRWAVGQHVGPTVPVVRRKKVLEWRCGTSCSLHQWRDSSDSCPLNNISPSIILIHEDCGWFKAVLWVLWDLTWSSLFIDHVAAIVLDSSIVDHLFYDWTIFNLVLSGI